MANPSSYAPGTEATLNGRLGTIKAPVSEDEVLFRFSDTGDISTVQSTSLRAPSNDSQPILRHHEFIAEEDWAEAERRLEAIKPLLGLSKRTTKDILKRAKEIGVGKSTLYRWIKDYERSNRLSDLAPKRRVKHKKRLSKEVEAIVQDVIQKKYLTRQKLTITKTADKISRRCKNAGLKPPHIYTVKNRINEVDERERTRRRHGAKAARDKYGEAPDQFPGADYPLAVVQIDHTKLDLEIVDDEYRMNIGRPRLTWAMDVYSRMITGLFLSLDDPSAFSIGMCINHSALEKNTELDRLGIEGKWPVWGKMRTIHTDNGKDFRSKSFEKSCKDVGITIEHRPVKKPEFGGHIESLMRRIANEVHVLPGTTFSNISKKGSYDSSKKSCLTYSEIYWWIVDYIVNDYHQVEHRGIGTSPLHKWTEGLKVGTRGKKIGLIPPIQDPEKFEVSFLPYNERTVQRNGISWDGINYYSPTLKEWIRESKGNSSVKFIVRRDPRNISFIYFLNPKSQQYEKIPISRDAPEVYSLWDLRGFKKSLREKGVKVTNQNIADLSRDRRDKMVEEAVKKTKKVRLENQKKKNRRITVQKDKKPTSLKIAVDNTQDHEEEDTPLNIDVDALKRSWKEQS